MYMLDTNICIYLIKNRNAALLERFKEGLSRGLCISVITFAELLYGVEKSTRPSINLAVLDDFLQVIKILPFDSNSAMEYGKICAYLQKKGTPIGVMDMLIASHAISSDAVLITNNMKEFERVPYLKLENWV